MTKKEIKPLPWMNDLANKYGIDTETVLSFYKTITYDHHRKMKKRARTEEFFDLYFEGRNEHE